MVVVKLDHGALTADTGAEGHDSQVNRLSWKAKSQ